MAKGSLGGNAGIKKKKKDDAEFDITPMIDVVFLLLIFFMVSSTMDDQKAANVPPAVHGIGADANGATIVSVLADGSGGARVVLGDSTDGEEVVNLVSREINEVVIANVIVVVEQVPHRGS